MLRRFIALMVCLTTAATIAVQSSSADGPPPFWMKQGCDHGHKSKKAYKVIRGLIRHTDHIVRKHRVQHWATCLATRAKAHHAHEVARAAWKWRHSYPQIFAIRVSRFPYWVINHLTALIPCESGGNPRALGGGGAWRGLFQFTFSTWASVGGSGDPIDAHPDEQWYRAGVLLMTSGPQHWPNCP